MFRRATYILAPLVATLLSIATILSPRSQSMLGLFAIAASAAATYLVYSLHRRCGQLAQSLHDGTPTDCGAFLKPLTTAVTELLQRTETATATAALRAKEMELRLKVADAERQHAEAIIYSISDAVLVTDAFDELVMANQSAARAFDFDLEKAERSPVATILKDPRLIGLIREMRQANNRAERRVVEHAVRTASGAGRTYKITLSTVADKTDAGTADSEPAGVVAVLHD